METSIAVKKFRIVNCSVNDALGMLDETHKPEPSGGEAAILRGLYCVTVSAVEEYFSSLGIEVASSRLLPLSVGSVSIPMKDEYMSLMEELRQRRPGKNSPEILKSGDIGRERIIYDFNAISFTAAFKFFELVKYCSGYDKSLEYINLLDDEVSKSFGNGPSTDGRWALVVDRRNMIAHGGDFEPGGLQLRDLDFGDVRYVSGLSKMIVELAERVCSSY